MHLENPNTYEDQKTILNNFPKIAETQKKIQKMSKIQKK